MVKVRRNVSGCFRAPGGEEAAEQDGVKSASAVMYAGRRAAWLRRLIASFLIGDRQNSDEASGVEAADVPRPRVWHGG